MNQMRRGWPVLFTLGALACVYGQTAPLVTFNISAPSRPLKISPLIYGMNWASAAQANALRLPLNRNGGNAVTRYNWQQNCTSSGVDWYFLSHTESGTAPGQSVDDWVAANTGAGAKSMVTVPLIGWVAKIGANRESLWSYSVAKYGAQQSVEPYRPDAGNGFKPDGKKLFGNDPGDANIPVSLEYQRGWLQHLIGRYGIAGSGGVGYYLLDNEAGLWHESHFDVFPSGVTMDDLFARQLAAAQMIKQEDPGAQVVGPEAWGWLEYLYSGADFQWSREHNYASPGPDRDAHGGMDQGAWQLQQFRIASQNAGKRLLDVFSVHYYPQGNYSDTDTSQAAQLWRNRSTRSLWDPNYTDESWINEKLNLVPRLKGWINTYYPGTKLGITEYNFGAENHINGAIAQADAMGIFGRLGVDIANRWVCPPVSSITFKAAQMYMNYDGAGGKFGQFVLPIGTLNPDVFSAYGSYDTMGGPYKIMLLNKSLTDLQPVKFVLRNSSTPRSEVYRLTSLNSIQRLADVNGTNGVLSVSLPKQSITLLVMRR